MNKNVIAIIVFLILLVIFASAFSSSYTSHNISNLAYVLALGIDVGEKAKMKISAQFTNSDSFLSGSGSSDESSNIVLVSSESDSIYSCLNLINTYIGKEINLSHCSIVIFSEEFAKNGISSQIYSLLNNEEFRPTTNLVISTCDAYDYLNNVKPNLEKLTTIYYDTFSITNKFTGYFSNITVGDFFNTYSNPSCNSTAILGGLDKTARQEENSSSSTSSSTENNSSQNDSNSSDTSSDKEKKEDIYTVTTPEDLLAGTSTVEGKRGSENIGIAVFEGDKFKGELTAIETICHLLINNDIDSCIISINNPYKESESNTEEKLELILTPVKKAKITVKIEDNIPHIYVKIAVRASILTLVNNINYEEKDVLEKFSDVTKDYMKKEFNSYFNKISREYETDIDCFSTKALAYFPTINDWNNYNWSEKFKDAKFDININIDSISSMLLTKI